VFSCEEHHPLVDLLHPRPPLIEHLEESFKEPFFSFWALFTSLGNVEATVGSKPLLG
jgi:hypothetical protein